MKRAWKIVIGLGLAAITPLAAITLPLLLLVAAGMLIFAGPDCAHRSDRDMERWFLKHRHGFEELVRAFEEDSTLMEGPYRGEFDYGASLSPERQQLYQRLYRTLRVRKIERDGKNLILIRVTTTRTFDRKGYACARRSPPGSHQGVVVHGETVKEADSFFRVFRPMSPPHWYVYFQPMS